MIPFSNQAQPTVSPRPGRMSYGIHKKGIASALFSIFAGCAVLSLFAGSALATTTGKIAGSVIDFDSGQPIAGARVEIVGAPYYAITDDDGEYYMIEVPAGEYTLKVIAPGYNPVSRTQVRVLLDLTTPVDMELTDKVTEFTDPITVIAERPLIQKDLTATRYTVTAEEMSYLPNSVEVSDILQNVSGSVVDRNGDVHIRGGRAGEVTYIYDGVIVNEPIFRDLGIRIVPEFLEEINMTSGGFPAEYGEASSAVVNAVTREGQSFYTGSVKLYDGWTQHYDVYGGKFGSLGRSDNQGLSVNFSGPLNTIGLKNSTFFIAGEALRDGGFLPHNFRESLTFTGKLTYRPIPRLKITGSGSYYKQNRQHYIHRDVNGISYDFNLDGLPITRSESNMFGVQFNYTKDVSTIFQANINHYETETKLAPSHLFDLYWNQWPGYVADSTGAYDPALGTLHVNNYNFAAEYGNTGYTYGSDFLPRYQYSKTDYNSISTSMTRQFNKVNQLKIGGEYRMYQVMWDDKQFYNATPYGEIYNQKPVYGFAYAQNKLEYQDVILNLGLRFDYFKSNVDYFVVENFQTSGSNLGVRSNPATSDAKYQVSPRLGVSHPIAENTILRFNYGYFFQPPKFWTMYTNLAADLNSGFPLLGNPDLKPEKTIAYELGLNHALNSSMTLDITAYYKDIENLIATRQAAVLGGGSIATTFVNEDFSNVKGFDISISKRRTRYFSGTLNYSYMVARGVAPDETYAYYNIVTVAGESLPVSSHALDFDQRHTLTVNADVRTPRDWQGKLLGLVPMSGAWGLSVVGRYGSGLPYTKFDLKTGNQVGTINEFRMPITYTFDARINRDFYIGNGGNILSLFVEVENLFDRRNVVNVYNSTGRPDDDGVTINDGGGLITAQQANVYHDLITNDPLNYSPPRTIRTGLQFHF